MLAECLNQQTEETAARPAGTASRYREKHKEMCQCTNRALRCVQELFYVLKRSAVERRAFREDRTHLFALVTALVVVPNPRQCAADAATRSVCLVGDARSGLPGACRYREQLWCRVGTGPAESMKQVLSLQVQAAASWTPSAC
jgi:hypothetical protein